MGLSYRFRLSIIGYLDNYRSQATLLDARIITAFEIYCLSDRIFHVRFPVRRMTRRETQRSRETTNGILRRQPVHARFPPYRAVDTVDTQ